MNSLRNQCKKGGVNNTLSPSSKNINKLFEGGGSRAATDDTASGGSARLFGCLFLFHIKKDPERIWFQYVPAVNIISVHVNDGTRHQRCVSKLDVTAGGHRRDREQA
jgi:hypothetical protein